MARKVIGPTGSRRRRWLLLLCLAVTASVAVVLIPSAAANSVKNQTFELDGNIAQDHPAAPTTYDWANFFDSSGARSPVLPDASRPGYTASSFVRDFNTSIDRHGNLVFDTSDSSTYTIGSKDILDVNGWSCTPANNVTDKGDIMNAYAVAYTDPGSGHKFVFFGMERNANAGDANVAFWFLQGGASCPAAGGSFSGSHQNGDLLIVSAFTNGGSVSTIDAYEWQNGALSTTPVAHGQDCRDASQTGDPTCATSNTTVLNNIPWLTENKSDGVGHRLQTGEFFEGGLDLSAPGVNLANNCFNTFIPDTRSSQSLTATLYDFAIGQLGECHATTQTTPSSTSDGNTPIPAAGISVGTGNTGVDVYDKAVVTVSGVSSFGGSVSYHLCGPTPLSDADYTLCTSGGALIGSSKSIGPPSPATVVSDAAHLTEAGRYCWRADYSGDASIGLQGSSDSAVTECFKVLPVQPTLTTTATTVVEVGNPIDDTAHLNGTAFEQGTGGLGDGSINPTARTTKAQGSITLRLFGPSATATCNTAIATRTVSVNGDGDYKASDGTGTGSLTPSTPGTYYWTASYTGDSPNTLSASDSCGADSESSKVVDALITIGPSATNEVGQEHTFTVHVEANDASGNGFQPVSGLNPTVTLTSSNGASDPPLGVTDNCASTGTDANGDCTVTFHSDTAGQVTGHASITFSVGGLSLTRATGDSNANDSDDAVKTFVDALITIGPDATNEVGQEHTFTVHVEADDGYGSGFQPVSGVNPAVTLTSSNGASDPPLDVTDDCASTGTDSNGDCTVTFHSDTAGQVTGHASITLTLAGKSVTRATGDSNANDSADAVKTYVDANIVISPLTAANPVNTDHVLTATVQINAGDGAGFVDAPDGTTITFSLANSNGASADFDPTGTDSCTTTGGSCSISIKSPTAGTTTITAAVDITVGTVPLHRETGDGLTGDSDNAVKNWSNASISIAPDATNEVGQSHTFTVTLEKDTGGGLVPAAGEHVDFTLTDDNGASHTSPTGTCTDSGPNTDANGQCTITFTSLTAGTVTGQASSTLTVNGVTFTVATDGAGGTGNAVKTFVDAEVSIAPDATNGITESHTFTVTVSKDVGDEAGFVPAAGAHVDVDLTNAGGASHSTPTGTCTNSGPNTDANGQCTITFTSNSAGTVTGHATATVTVDTVTMTRETDGLNGNSDDAVKTFVQGSLSWIKHDGSGNLLGGATFQVCATDGTAASVGHTPLCVTVLDNGPFDADPVAGQFELDAYQSFGGSALGGLALGTYTIQETVAPAGFTLDPFVETIMVTQADLNPAATHIWVDTQPGQGCTPGFWKNHTAAWNGNNDATVIALKAAIDAAAARSGSPAYSYNSAISGMTNQLFGQIFALSGTNLRGLSSSLTLLGALNLGGGGFQALARHGTAALLSSVSVQYPYSAAQVLDGVHNAFVANNSNQVSAGFPDGVLTDLTNANNLDERACPSS